MDTPLSLPQLDNVAIAAPCPARWEDMVGDDAVRHCGLCELNVYNVAAMSADEAARVLAPALRGERVCARLLRRADGTYITRDCPVGVASARERLLRGIGRIAAGIALALCGGTWAALRPGIEESGTNTLRIRSAQPFAAAAAWLNPPPPLPVLMMGKVSTGSIRPAPLFPSSPGVLQPTPSGSTTASAPGPSR